MATRLFTAEDIGGLFSDAHDEAEEAYREATRGPFNPFGDSGYDSQVVSGPLQWHWERQTSFAKTLIRDANEDRNEADSIDFSDDWDQVCEAIEAAALGVETVVGTGRPIYAAEYQHCPTVFCETAEEDAVNEAVKAFYSGDDPELYIGDDPELLD